MMANLIKLASVIGMSVLLMGILTVQASVGSSAAAIALNSENPRYANAPVIDLTGTLTPVTISLPTLNASVGDSLAINLMINSSEPTRAAQFGLTFDPTVLRCESTLEGTFYSNWAGQNGATTFVFPVPTCDNVNGIVTMMGIVVLGGQGGPTGSGILAIFNFTVIGTGASPLDLTDVIIADDSPEAQPLPTTIVNGAVYVGVTPTITPTPTRTPTITLTPSPTIVTPTDTATAYVTATPSETPVPGYCDRSDVNGDAHINIVDLALVSVHFLEEGSPGWIPMDVIVDGWINVLDLCRVGECFGQDPTPTPTESPTPTEPTSTPTPTEPTPTPIPTQPTHTPTSTVPPSTPTLSATPTPTGLPANTIVSVLPPVGGLSANDQFEVAIQINTLLATRAAQFGLSFDPNILRCEDIVEGTFYSDWAAENGAMTLTLPTPKCDNTNGQITLMGITLLGGVGGPTGTGDLAKITFTALKDGTSFLTLNDVIIADDGFPSQPLSVVIENAQVLVGATPTPQVTPSKENTILSITAPVNSLQPGEKFDVILEIDTIRPSRAAQFTIAFEPDVIQCVSITEGTFYSDWAAENGASTFVFPKPTCDNSTGLATMMGITLLGGTSGPTGHGSLATYQFTVTGLGISPLTIQDAIVADDSPESQALPLTLRHGTIVVEEAAAKQTLYIPIVFLNIR